MSDSLTTNNTDNIDNTEPLAVSPDTDGSVTTKKAKKEFPPVRRNWFARFLLCCVSFFAVFGIVNFVFFKLGMEPFGSKSAAIDDAKIQYIDFFTYYVDISV